MVSALVKPFVLPLFSIHINNFGLTISTTDEGAFVIQDGFESCSSVTFLSAPEPGPELVSDDLQAAAITFSNIVPREWSLQ